MFKIFNKFLFVLVIAVASLFATAAFGATVTLRVKPDGLTLSQGATGATWNLAFKFPQDALAAARDLEPTAENPVQLWVAAGTYIVDRDSDHPTGHNPVDQTISFELGNFISLYGGFEVGDDDLGDRDPVANVTILSGHINPNYLAFTS